MERETRNINRENNKERNYKAREKGRQKLVLYAHGNLRRNVNNAFPELRKQYTQFKKNNK